MSCFKLTNIHLAIMIFLLSTGTLYPAESGSRYLYRFDQPGEKSEWQVVDDDVMGGVSKGFYNISEQGVLNFHGTLSMDNNGGFSSLRSTMKELRLKNGDTIVLRVRGDGRTYSLNLYPRIPRIAFSYRAEFKTSPHAWIDVSIPLDTFIGASFGQPVRNDSLDPGNITALGITLSDKKPGPFRIEVQSIQVIQTEK